MRTSLPRFALSLLAVFALAKTALVLCCLADSSASGLRSPWALPALIFEDLLVAGTLWLAGRAAGDRLPAARIAAYAAACLYTAINVPVARVCSTPLTYPMLPAAGGALADSLVLYLTAGNLACAGLVLAAGAALPWALRRWTPAWRWPLLGAALALLCLGPAARNRVDSRGLHRNAILTLLRTAAYQLTARGPAQAITATPPRPPQLPPLAPPVPAQDLRSLRGAAHGRNVLWVVLESTAAQYLRPFGALQDPMPRLSALAAQAILFPHAYAVYPESIKGLFSTLCSTAPAAHTPATRYTERRLPCDSIAARFAGAGYHTGMFHSGWFLYLGMKGIVQERGFSQLLDAGVVGGEFATSFGVDERATVRRVLEFIDRRPPGRPFFAMYLPITGHHPYYSPGPQEDSRPRPFTGQAEIDRYRNDLALGDQALGELLDGLDRRGLLRDTVIAVNGDHGEAFYQHEGNFAHSLFLYEENVHVPLLLAAPGLIRAQARAGQVASLLDVAPTLLDLCGLQVPARYQGRSLLDPAPGAAARFLTDHAVWQLGLRHGPYKFIYDVEGDKGRLFDLTSDPQEHRDLAPRMPGRARSYRDDLLGWSARQRAWLAGSY